MTGKDLAKAVIDLLVRAGKVPANCTGKISLTVDMSQGGVSAADLALTERLK